MDSATEYKKAVKKTLKSGRIFYVCRDLERATGGLNSNIPNFFIITNQSPLATKLGKKYSNVKIIKNKLALDTHELLDHPKVKKMITKKDFIVVFKNTALIEKICSTNKWKLLNPKASLASQVEEKISQVKFLGPLKKYLPNTKIVLGKNLKWTGKKFILQYNRAHTGSGTFLITSTKQLNEIKKTFPNREIRISDYIEGPFFTNNNCIWNNDIILGNINFQITGLTPFTDNPFATTGNDWAAPHANLDEKQFLQYIKIASEVGIRLAISGWKGLFGIDTVLEIKTGKIYLIEINARQPASTTFEAQLQQKIGLNKGLTTFEAHIGSLLKIKNRYQLIKINSGAQIIQRITKKTTKIKTPKKNKYFNFIKYNNTKSGSDLLRIQSLNGIMKNPTELNKFGKQILKLIHRPN
ncbi:MAG: hypothetical protein Q7J14_01290 [Candidatus Magasanikbacteria bacterium]|nr:hypothetical protein [Candidatus Magasanikbacteria bacterium]